MSADEREERRKRHHRYGFIPAGVLIGLGVGLLAGYPGSGVLIGLGLGFLASALVPTERDLPETSDPGCGKCVNWMMLLPGIFLILIGVGIIWVPVAIWPYLIAAFLILLGIGFLVRGFHKNT
jgi:hypothetical protein